MMTEKEQQAYELELLRLQGAVDEARADRDPVLRCPSCDREITALCPVCEKR